MFGWLFNAKESGTTAKAKAGGTAQAAKAKPAPPKRMARVNLDKRYTIVAETGQGSMSRVYRAMDNQSGRTVCLKVQDKAKSEAAAARGGTSLAGRPSEGEIGLKIIHPNVVKTYEFGMSTKGEHFIAMEFIDGVSLQYVRESRVMDIAERVEMLAQAAEGLAALHAAGFIHHDFGPKNALVNRDNTVKIIDFGLAVPDTPQFHRPGNRTGTLSYMAPELIRRETTDARIDIFSFGATAFEFFTGRLPYDVSQTDPMAMMRARINAEPLKLASVAPKLPPELCELIDKTLAKRKEDRWPKMSTLAEAFRELPVPSR